MIFKKLIHKSPDPQDKNPSSDEDEIAVLETEFIDTELSPNNSEEVVNPLEIKEQKCNFECEDRNERFRIVRRGEAGDMFYRQP